MGPHDGCSRDSQLMPMSYADSQDLPGPQKPAPQATVSEFASYVVNRLFSVGLSLDSARSIAGNGPTGDRIVAATDEVDELIRDIRTTVFSPAADPSAALRTRTARTARELQARALEAAALLEREADLARQPSRLDYPTEIKRWLAFAEQADQMARQWEQPP